jgi:putative ABC transport system substrate-binding protein
MTPHLDSERSRLPHRKFTLGIRRREFIALLGGAAAWPLAARAQKLAMPVVGFLSTGGSQESQVIRLSPFRQSLREAGYVEGQNLAINYRWAEDRYDRLASLAADLVRRNVAVIVAAGTNSAIAAKAATSTIPVVFGIGGDPVNLGLVASLNRPGGNLTGVFGLVSQLELKRLELLHELVPTATSFALLVNPAGRVQAEQDLRDVQVAAHTLGLQIHVLNASTEREINMAFPMLVQLHAGGLLIIGDNFFNNRIEQLAALAISHAVPVIYASREFAAVGGLMSYGPSLADNMHLVGVYTGRILKGEKATDLPVQQSTKVELVINLKTARALGITVPLTLRAFATEVIE